MIDFEKFTERFYPTANISRQDDIKRFLKHLEELTGDKQIESILTNEQQMCSLFFLQKTGNVSRPHYQKIKEYLLRICDFLGVKGTIPSRETVLASQQKICYFRSIDDLLSFIDDIGRDTLSTYDPTSDLVRVKSICILGWLGWSAAAIADMQIKDLIPIGFNGFKLCNQNNAYEIYGEAFASLYYLSSLDEYNSLPSGKRVFLSGNKEFLFRPTSKGEERLTELSIIQVLKRFNALIPSSSKRSIVFRNLHKNNLFLEIYNDHAESNLIAKIIKHMNCSQNYALNYKNQYLEFVNALENNKI